jgi:predicted transcriptional regulator
MVKMATELLMEEKLVLSTIQEYLNKNRYFNMKEILPFIHARFKMASININLRGIEEALKTLARKKLIVEGSKLTKKDVLNNKKRRNIYNFIVETPGIYINRIVRDLKISYHVVVWHLSMLLKFDFIKKEIIENHEIYFESGFNVKRSKFKYLTSKEKSRIIISYLKTNDIGISKTQISTDLKMHINTTSKYLDSLEEYKIIIKKRASNKVLYFLNEDFIET